MIFVNARPDDLGTIWRRRLAARDRGRWRNDHNDEVMVVTEFTGRGVVTRLVADMHFGVVTTADGVEVYFHRNAVLGDAFDRLRAGSQVRFTAAPGLLGAQALTVELA